MLLGVEIPAGPVLEQISTWAFSDINAMLHQVFVNNKTKQENLNIGVAPPSGSGLQKPYPASTHISMSRLYIAVTGANRCVSPPPFPSLRRSNVERVTVV